MAIAAPPGAAERPRSAAINPAAGGAWHHRGMDQPELPNGASHRPPASGEARRAPRLTPPCFDALARIIAADSVETAAPIAAELLGRAIPPANVAQQMRRARNGGPLAADTLAAIENLEHALGGLKRSRRTGGQGTEAMLSMLREGQSIPEAAAGAGVSLQSVYEAIRADRKQLDGEEHDAEAAELGRAIQQATSEYRSEVLAATARGEDTRWHFRNLERLEASGAMTAPEATEDRDRAWNWYRENIEVIDNPNLDAIEALLAQAGDTGQDAPAETAAN